MRSSQFRFSVLEDEVSGQFRRWDGKNKGCGFSGVMDWKDCAYQGVRILYALIVCRTRLSEYFKISTEDASRMGQPEGFSSTQVRERIGP
jgi:hypothetical protein